MTIEEEKIFDLTTLDDLNDEVKKQLHIASTGDKEILELFKIKNILNIDEIIVGMARKYKTTKKRSYIINRLYNLVKKGFLTKVTGKKGLYQLIK